MDHPVQEISDPIWIVAEVNHDARKYEHAHLRIVPARYYTRTAGTVLAIGLIVVILNSVFGNPHWEWGVFSQWFFAEPTCY